MRELDNGAFHSKNGKTYRRSDEDGKWYSECGDRYIKKYVTDYKERPPWLVGKGFENNPQNIDEGGSRKSIKTIINRLKSNDFETFDKKSLLEVYKLMFNTPLSELKKIANDHNTPWGFKIIFDNLQDKRTRAKAWETYQSWVFGKAPDAGEVSKQKDDIDFENMSEEQRKAYMTIVKNINSELDESTGTNN